MITDDRIIVKLFPDWLAQWKDGSEYRVMSAGSFIRVKRKEYTDWCEENLGPCNDRWSTDGVTLFSYRIIFSDPDDAIVFKLRFGL